MGAFAKGLYYLPADIGNAEDYRKLSELLDRIDRERGTAGNRLFYLSIGASAFYAESGRTSSARPASSTSRSGQLGAG